MDNRRIWIDDWRNPQSFLKNEAEGVLWLKQIKPALDYVDKHAEEIEVLYLDHWMDDDYLNGFDFVSNILDDGREKYKNLKNIYFHSGDDKVIEEVMFYEDMLKEIGVVLLIAPYRVSEK